MNPIRADEYYYSNDVLSNSVPSTGEESISYCQAHRHTVDVEIRLLYTCGNKKVGKFIDFIPLSTYLGSYKNSQEVSMSAFNTHPLIAWWMEGTKLFIQFRRMTSKEFLRTKVSFKQQFSHARWNNELKAWELSVTDLQDVALFTEQQVGSRCLCHLAQSDKPHQLAIPFTWNDNPKKCTRRRKNE